MVLLAQEEITLKFSANAQNGAYCPFDVVNVTNVTRGWNESLIYPDTTLVLSCSVGIKELEGNYLNLLEVYPNPFSEYANIDIELKKAGFIDVQLLQINGEAIAKYKGVCEAGAYRITVTLKVPQMAFLVVAIDRECQAVKLLHSGNGKENSIMITPIATKQEPNPSKTVLVGDFVPGDIMSYEAVLIDNGEVVNSNRITQQQFENETITLDFSVTTPSINTLEITDITRTTAMGQGDVSSSGGLFVLERGLCWGTSPNPSINDNFSSCGSGLGVFSYRMTGLVSGTVYYVRAYARNVVGVEYGNEESFMTSIVPDSPIGAVDGLFSVSETQQVWFSQGNLQFIGSNSTPYWKFAENQWDFLGDNGQGSVLDAVDRDLFGWGTSGFDHGAVCYQPWSTAPENDEYYAYGSYEYSLFDQTGEADWGMNPISNGGNISNYWRTLSGDEWSFVFNTRNTASGSRYAKALVNGIKGVVLLPDDWSNSIYLLNGINDSNADFSINDISNSIWMEYFQCNGAVFLPSAGDRLNTSVGGIGACGVYWSSSRSDIFALGLGFYDTGLNPSYEINRFYGQSVRLVRNAE